LVLLSSACLQIAWYELPAFYVFHVANAWEDDSGVVKVRDQAGIWGLALLSNRGNRFCQRLSLVESGVESGIATVSACCWVGWLAEICIG
jgi:hypothetical protein